jgi:uncharacterized OB-fold protein
MSAMASTNLAAEYFAWHAQNEFRLQRCQLCRRWSHPPVETCPECGSVELAWEPASGHGTVFTWTITHHPFAAAFADRIPYPVVVVQCAEGPRVLTTVVGLEENKLETGMSVVVEFMQLAGDAPVAVFRPVS